MSIQKLPPDVLRLHKGVSFVGVTTVFLCYDRNGRFFMGKRSKNARDEHGNWDMGGGGLKWGEAAEENMKREVKEEYNGTVLKSTFLGYGDAFRTLADGTKTHWVALYFAALVDPSEIKIQEPEMFEDSGWFTLDSLPSPLHSQAPAFFKKYGEQLNTLVNQK
jgi:8-oxo-dGTP diphosphatase